MRKLSMLLVPGLVSMALAAGPVLTSAYAAGGDEPTPPKSDTSTKKEKKKKKYESFLAKFLKKHGRLSNLADEDPYMAEFMDFLSEIRKCLCN